jgi:hypothetical protein
MMPFAILGLMARSSGRLRTIHDHQISPMPHPRPSPSKPDIPPLLGFVHIEKAAGTTLLYILRRNYLFRYLDVRPLHAPADGMFKASDLRTCLRINPFLRCIGGHAVRPCSDLEIVAPDIRYITLLRDPVQRYLSQYRYWLDVLGKDWTFEEFLQHEPSFDFQTRKIAGSRSLDSAKRILTDRFFLVGVAEQFDEFILELRARVSAEHFDPHYTRRNVAGKREEKRITQSIERHIERIHSNNAADIALYRYVVDELIPRQRGAYAGELAADLEAFRRSNDGAAGGRARLLADALCRKLYYEPVTGLVRLRQGLPMKGSY